MTRALPFVAFASLLALAPGARAHIELDEPLVRHDNGGSVATEINKQPPCGLGGANDVRDPARVTTFQPGETITVRFRETIGHTGRMRVAFSPSGNAQADFNAHVLADVADPPNANGNTGNGNQWAIEVTLPNTPCDNCTLQLVQVMNGDTVHEVADPTQFNTYYQCADLILAAPGADAGPGPETDAGTGEPDAGTGVDAGPGPETDAGTTPEPDAGTGVDAGPGPEPDAGTDPEPDAGTDPSPDAGPPGDGAPEGCGGCGSTAGVDAAVLFGLASLLRLRRRRRRA